MITCIIDGVDISAYIQQQTDISETMRKITGNAQATAIDGTTIPNQIAVKWDPSFVTRPLPQPIAESIIAAMERETVTLQYTSVKVAGSGARTITAFPVSMSVSYATDDYTGVRVYAPMTLSFEEQ